MSQVKDIKESVDRHPISVTCAPSITERILESFTLYECVIENYSKLSDKICYMMNQETEYLERTLKFYKTKESHSFQLHCELKNSDIQLLSANEKDKMRFYILYKEDKPVCPGELTETSYGYSIKMSSKCVTQPANKYLLEKDKLVIRFTYRNYIFCRNPLSRSGVPRNRDEERLSKDLLSLYESGKFTDFTIIDGDDKKHFVHRSICRSRSVVIDQMGDFDVGALIVEGKFLHVEAAIRYMYSGILPQLSIDNLLRLLEVAHELGIEVLLLSIQQALEVLLNKGNALKMVEVTSRYSRMAQLTAIALDLQNPEKCVMKKGRW